MLAFIQRIADNHKQYGVRGLMFAAKSRLIRHPTTARVRPPGIRRPLILRTRTTDPRTCSQVFLKAEYAIDLARQPRVIIDAGANIGLTSIYFTHRFPAARIIAIEPERTNFALLEQNVCDYSNISPVHAAVWKRNTTLDLVDPGLGHWGFQTQAQAEQGHVQILGKVPGLTIDGIMHQFDLDYVDLLKVDIEGSEQEVFENASAWIDRIGVIIIELHDNFREHCSRNVYRAVSDFEYESRRGESHLFARAPYVPDGTTATGWRRRPM